MACILSVMKALDFQPAKLDWSLAVTHIYKSLVVMGRASGQICCRAPEKASLTMAYDHIRVHDDKSLVVHKKLI